MCDESCGARLRIITRRSNGVTHQAEALLFESLSSCSSSSTFLVGICLVMLELTASGATLVDMPMYVLVNGNTASAAEVYAAALQVCFIVLTAL